MEYEEDSDMEILSDMGSQRERKNLRTILNRGKMDRWELDDFLGN